MLADYYSSELNMKKHWPELLVFGLVLIVLVVCMTPDFTWINTDSDGIHYIYSAKYMYPSHKTSAPLYLLLGNLFLRLPFGTEAWRMALISVMASFLTTIFVYLAIRELTSTVSTVRSRIYALIGSLAFGSSALVISQSTIIETYTWVTMASIGAYYFSLKGKWKLTALILGLGFAVHFLTALAAIPILIKYRREMWKTLPITIAFFAFYAYIPLTNREPYMWFPSDNLAGNWVSDNLNTGLMLIGGISIWDLPKRILDATGVLTLSLIPVIPLSVYGAIKKRNLLTVLFLLPILLYITNLAPQTYVYLLPAIAWGCIIAGDSLQYIDKKIVVYGTASIAVLALLINCWMLDIGRTLDPELSARRFYDEELPKLGDNDILIARNGWEWAAVFLYNREENTSIRPICVGTLSSSNYQQDLENKGVELVNYSGGLTFQRDTRIVNSVIEKNENVWITEGTDISTYGAEIVPATSLLPIPEDPYTDGYYINWSIDNPYDIITGSIEVEKWNYIIFTNMSALLMVMLGTITGVPMWIAWQILVKKKKWRLHKQEVQDLEV